MRSLGSNGRWCCAILDRKSARVGTSRVYAGVRDSLRQELKQLVVEALGL
jgi:hypothetical protein